MSDRIITNRAYVDELPMYVFDTASLPDALKGITGEVTSTHVIGTKTYVRCWKPTDARRVEMEKGQRITIREFKKLLPESELANG